MTIANPTPVALAALVACATAACAPKLQATTLPELLDEAVGLDVPGIVIVARGPDGADFAGAAGLADVDGAVPMSPESGFRIASNSKAFVGLTLASLATEGAVDLDQPMGELLPPAATDGIENAALASLRQALQHQSGIVDYLDSDAYWDAVDGRTRPWTLDETLTYARGADATFDLGEGWAYSNTNYILAGLAIEAVTGEPWGRAVRERVLDPAGMTSSFVENQEDARIAIAHGYSEGVRDMYAVDTGYGLPDGGIVATAPELAGFIRAVGGGPAPEGWPTQAAALLLADPVSSEADERYGLGLAEYPTACGRTIGHGGGLEGYLSEMFYAPDRGVTLVVFMNASDGRMDRIFGRVVERALELVCGE